MPEGWSEVCASNGKMECFLKRHAASWGMACSRCIEPRKCCNNPHPENCPRCEKADSPWPAEAADTVRDRALREADTFASRDVVVILSPHYYLVTDIPSLKIHTQGGAPRVAGMHELAHIYAERCEKARREFVQHFGETFSGSAPSAVYLPRRETTAEKVQVRNFASPRTNVLYGGGAAGGRLAGGLCGNGFSASLQKHGSDDEGLHHAVRHMAGHLLISTWASGDPTERALPPWMFEGVAHWLAKRHPLLEDGVVWCAGEGNALSGSGRSWDAEARKAAADPKLDPVEKILDKSTVGFLTFEDHVRAWSYFSICLKEDREKFVAVLRALRAATAARQAWTENGGCTPEQWDRRWRDRVLARRASMSEVAADREKDEGPGAADRRALRTETDPETLAARVRSLGTCGDPLTAAALVELFARRSDRVRETIAVLLSRSTDPEVLRAIREKGLSHADPTVRGYAARVLGLAGDAASAEALRSAAADREWFVRAEAAGALTRLRDPMAVDAIRPLLEDQAPKVRIAAMDAAGAIGTPAEKVASKVAANLDHPAWQVRSAAADSLGGIGSMMGVEALIQRMTTEAGRVRVDCHRALKAITRDDLGLNPENWAKWWKRERERVGGGVPDRPGAPPEPNPEDLRYGPKERLYGIRVYDERVGYVLDMSSSMHVHFNPDEVSLKRLRRKYEGSSKFEISKEEIVQSIEGLDPRARFTVIAFADEPRFMSRTLLPATPDGRSKAEGFLRSCRLPPPTAPRGGGVARPGLRPAAQPSPPMTNFYAALLAALDLPQSGDPVPDFRETPDTMFFLTDGEPTKGEIVDADALLAWFSGHNRYARIRVHVVAYGNTGIDLAFLTHLAQDNGGQLIHILEARPEDAPALPPNTPR